MIGYLDDHIEGYIDSGRWRVAQLNLIIRLVVLLFGVSLRIIKLLVVLKRTFTHP